MGLFFNLLLLAGTIVLSLLLAPKPKKRREDHDIFEVPTATEARPIPVVFGCVRIKGPNTVAFTDNSFTRDKINA